MIAGIVIDPWKLDIFKKHLDRGEWKYTVHLGQTPPGVQSLMTVIKVECRYAHELQPFVQAAQDECAESKHE